MRRIESQRILLAKVCEYDWPVYEVDIQVDVQVAFLPSPIEDEVYVKIAPGQEERLQDWRAHSDEPQAQPIRAGPVACPVVWDYRHGFAKHRFHTSSI